MFIKRMNKRKDHWSYFKIFYNVFVLCKLLKNVARLSQCPSATTIHSFVCAAVWNALGYARSSEGLLQELGDVAIEVDACSSLMFYLGRAKKRTLRNKMATLQVCLRRKTEMFSWVKHVLILGSGIGGILQIFVTLLLHLEYASCLLESAFFKCS